MIKSPFKENGQLKFFELLKIFFLVSFIMAQISRLFTDVANHNSNQLLTLTGMTLLIVQLVLSNIELNRIIVLFVKSFVINITFKKTYLYLEIPLEIPFANLILDLK